MERRVIAMTGADGFVGKNLTLRLTETQRFDVRPLIRGSSAQDWAAALTEADAVVHLAGVNRPPEPDGFAGNVTAVDQLAEALDKRGRALPIILASSTKAIEPGPYGESKKAAEDAMVALGERTGSSVAVYRLPNIFGKWCRPNYNSAVATFCHNVARGLPIVVNDAAAPLNLVYVDDLADAFIGLLDEGFDTAFYDVSPTYRTSVGEVAAMIEGFRDSRADHRVGAVGTGLTRALYATYISYLPVDDFAYGLVAHRDPRGAFAEMLRTEESGQFSYFTAHPGVTRGGHYHHTKTEKFLVVHGEALFRFRHMLTGETHEVRTSGEEPVVVETIPGWTHDITNVGDEVMVSMLWANEIFDRDRPDTIAEKV